MKRCYIVSTDMGDYTNIWARSRAHAESIVWTLTQGRARNIAARLA